jgi:hypothetical protein
LPGATLLYANRREIVLVFSLRICVPEVLDVVERQLLTILGDVVLDIDDKTAFLATVEWPAEAAAQHLLVQHRAIHRPRDVKRAQCRRIEAGREDVVISRGPGVALAELLDVVPPRAGVVSPEIAFAVTPSMDSSAASR